MHQLALPISYQTRLIVLGQLVQTIYLMRLSQYNQQPSVFVEVLAGKYASEHEFVYLYHLSEPLIRSNGIEVWHYVGSTEDVAFRDRQHHWKCKQGGAALLKEATRRGIDFQLVRVWQASRAFERHIKQQKKTRLVCPICNPQLQFGFEMPRPDTLPF